ADGAADRAAGRGPRVSFVEVKSGDVSRWSVFRSFGIGIRSRFFRVRHVRSSAKADMESPAAAHRPDAHDPKPTSGCIVPQSCPRTKLLGRILEMPLGSGGVDDDQNCM